MLRDPVAKGVAVYGPDPAVRACSKQRLEPRASLRTFKDVRKGIWFRDRRDTPGPVKSRVPIRTAVADVMRGHLARARAMERALGR